MKKVSEILMRFLKVAYVILLLAGIVWGMYVWNNIPKHYYNYLVICSNGKTFDPTSKPIEKSYSAQNGYSFTTGQINSECAYETAFREGDVNQFEANFTLSNKEDSSDPIKRTIILLIGYYVLMEIIRRTFLYIFLGKNFITLKKK